MTRAAWLQPLTKTVAKLSPKSDLAQFRNEYTEIVRSIKDDGKTRNQELLLEAAPIMESWVTQEDKCPCCAVREWSTFYEKAAGELSLDVLVLIAKKLPQIKTGAVDWQPFFFSCRQKPVLVALYERRLVGKANLRLWVGKTLQNAYELPVLDVAIDNDAIPDYRALWEGCMKWGERPAGLYTREELLALCYSREPAEALDKKLYSFLFGNASAREPFFKAALSFPQLYLRVAEMLASAVDPDRSDDHGLINDFVTMCAAPDRAPNADIARICLALASLRLFLAARDSGRGHLREPTSIVDGASMQLASTALTQIEEDPSSQSGACISVLSAVQLHDIVHSHLKSLASFSSDTAAPADRSSKYERHLGRKEVLDKVLAALHESTDHVSLRHLLEVALFNLGVRPLGNVGDRTKFEARLHEAEESGIVPGDMIEIVDAGRCFAKGDETFVLTKAKVRGISS